MKRRNFIEMGGLLAVSALPIKIFANTKFPAVEKKSDKHIDFLYDGETLSPHEYSELLIRLVDDGKVKEDYYSNGGVVEELEHKFASLLGKESAVFMPTGTLANHIAIRELAQTNRRVIVQEQSHLYNDSGDCCQTLSDLNLIPLGKGRQIFHCKK